MRWYKDRQNQEYKITGTWLTSKKPYEGVPLIALFFLIMTSLSMVQWRNMFSVGDMFVANQARILENGEFWRLVTATFVHGDMAHLISNSLLLFIFGYFTISYYGPKVFLMLSFVIGSLVNFVSIMTYAPEIKLLGSSGVVYVLGGFWLFMYFLVQRQYSMRGRILRTLGIGILLFGPSQFIPNVSYRAHLFGFIFGALYSFYYFWTHKNHIRSKETRDYEWSNLQDVSF